MPVDVEFIKLLHEVHSEEIPGHIYRGYTIKMCIRDSIKYGTQVLLIIKK